jgi:hypothetical protein
MLASESERELPTAISLLLLLLLASSAALLALPATSQAAEATASLNPSAPTFESVVVGQRGPQQQFVLTNNGPEAIMVEAVSVTGVNPNDFSLENDGCFTATLSSQESCSLYISFAPSASGLREAQLNLDTGAENSPATAALSGRGLAQELTVSPSPLDFPTTTVDTNSERKVTVANESEAAVAIYNVSIEGAGSSSFNTNGSNCGTSLKPQQSCTISIRFSPGSEGEQRAYLHVRSEGNPDEQVVELFGISAPPQLSFEPESYEFGLQSIKEGGAQTTMQLRNTGEGSVQVSLEIAGSDQNDFYIGTSDCFGATLAPNETCSIEVHFNPNQAGFNVAQVRARTNNGATFSAEVSGTGGRAILSGSPNPADFGETAVGSAGQTRTVTLTNSGDLPGGFFIVLISGGDAGSFQLLEEDCTATRLEPEGSCTAQVRFQPTSPGLKSAMLTFVGGEEGVIQIGLNGLGVAPDLTLSPSGYDFGSQTENSAGPAQIFTITNEGNTPVALNATTITGANPDQFRLSVDTCSAATLKAGEGCQIGARFAPDSAGAKSAKLRLGTATEALTAALSGTGVPSAPPPTPNPPPPVPSNTFSFGKFKANTKQGTATQSLTAPGPGMLVLTGKDVKESKKTAYQQGGVTLSIVASGKAKSQLNKTGKVKVKIAVNFTPTGGASMTQKKTVKLVKKA